MIRVIVIGIIIIVSVLLETTVIEHISIFGIAPQLTLPIIVAYSMLRGENAGTLVGFISGLLKDILLGQAIGLFAMLGMLVGYFAGRPFRDFFRESYLLPMLLTGILSFIYSFIIYMFYSLTIAPINMFYHLGTVILPVAIYTMILSILIYRILYAINSILEFFERRRRKIFER